MNKYKKNIKLLIKNKYRESDYHDKKFLSDFISYRNHFKKRIDKNFTISQIKEKKDKTFLELKKYFENKIYNNKRIEAFYKKFEVNLMLKQNYNKKLILLTKKETSPQSYIYLGHLIIKLKKIDIFQKLNVILKIIDKLSVSQKYFKQYNKHLLIDLIQIEQRLIKKVIEKNE